MEKRIYGSWAGNPKGHPEDVSRCIVSVHGSGEWIPHQCLRKRGCGADGLYCKQHAKKMMAQSNTGLQRTCLHAETFIDPVSGYVTCMACDEPLHEANR